jgi:hypothetical protein
MTLPMVKVAGVPDRSDAKPGMAFFAGTGPSGKTCGDCKNRGYYRQGPEHWDETKQKMVSRGYRVQKCAQFKAMTGRHGTDVDAGYSACKYFEAKAKVAD